MATGGTVENLMGDNTQAEEGAAPAATLGARVADCVTSMLASATREG
jgi:hypothetical protein